MFRVALAGAALAFVVLPVGAAARWALQTDPELGFRYSYPVEVFSAHRERRETLLPLFRLAII